MFVPLQPTTPTGSAAPGTFQRWDVACCDYPPSMHCSTTVSSAAGEAASVAQSQSQLPSDATAAGQMPQGVIQVEAALTRSQIKPAVPSRARRVPDSEIAGVTIESLHRADPIQPAIAGPHWQRKSKRADAGDQSPSDAQVPVGGEPIGPTAVAPIDLTRTAYPAVLEPKPQTPSRVWRVGGTASRISPAESAAGSALPVTPCDWIWPKTVDELIGRQWNAISQLGRSAVANSRDDTPRIGVTSVRRGEGRTTLAIALARWSALTGRKTLLVDGDLRRAGIGDALHLGRIPDWRQSSVAFGIDDSIVSCRSLPLGLLSQRQESTGEEPETLEKMLMLLAVAEQGFDCCFIDLGPIDELIQQIGTVTRLATSFVVVNTHAAGISPHLISACNTMWQRGKPALVIADNLSR
jgi:Mrp family chromosome partitioning ATPase